MTAPLRKRWVFSGSTRLAIREYGDAADEPLLALHGFPESGLTWEAVAAPIVAAGRRVVAPDLRGHGQSDAPRAVRDYAMEILLDDVERVISDLDCGPVEIVAHDWGGGLAWLLAERRPQLVSRATILNVPHPGVLRQAILRDKDQRRRSRYALKMLVPYIPERRLSRDRGALLASLFPVEHYGAAVVDEYRTNWLRDGVVRGMLNWYRAAARDRSLQPPRDQIETPIAIVWGTADPLFAPSLVHDSAALGGSIDVSFEECGHAPHREMPATVASVVLGGAV